MVRVSLGTKGISVDWKEGGNPIKEPPKGLEPHGDSGWYHSPDVVDPRDCQFYPDSPWCGGNPVDLSVGIQAEINVDKCGITFDISGQVGIKFPHRVETYRSPGKCRREYEAAPPPPTVTDYGLEAKQASYGFNRSISDDEEVIAGITESYLIHNEYSCGTTPDVRFFLWGGYFGIGLNLEYGIGTYKDINNDIWAIEAKMQVARQIVEGNPDVVCGRAEGEQQIFTYDGNSDVYFNSVETNTEIWTINNNNQIYQKRTVAGNLDENHPDRAVPPYYSFKVKTYYGFAWVVKGKWGDIKRYFSGLPERVITAEEKPFIIGIETCFDVLRPNQPNSYAKNPPAPPPDPRNCCMQCCSSSSPQQQNNDDLLKKIYALLQQVDKNLGHAPIRVSIFDQNENAQEAQSTTLSLGSVAETLPKIVERIEKVSKIIGIDALPLTVPETISDPINDNILGAIWDWLTPDATRKINNLFEWNVWMLEQFSAVMGHWQQEITVEDTDVLKPGDQGVPADGGGTKKKIVLTDIATTLKEQTMLQLQLYKTLGLTLDVCLKTLTEGSSNAQQIAAIKAEINEIIDFLDYPTDDGYVDCPVQITVPGVDVSQEEQNDLGKFLKPTHSKVKYQNWNGKDSLRDRFMHLATLLSRPQH